MPPVTTPSLVPAPLPPGLWPLGLLVLLVLGSVLGSDLDPGPDPWFEVPPSMTHAWRRVLRLCSVSLAAGDT